MLLHVEQRETTPVPAAPATSHWLARRGAMVQNSGSTTTTQQSVHFTHSLLRLQVLSPTKGPRTGIGGLHRARDLGVSLRYA